MDQPSSNPSEIYAAVAQKILEADVFLFGAGAGIGVGSGLGTFRGQAAGVWPPLEKRGLRFPDMSNPSRFLSNDKYGPKLAWAFWQWRYCAYVGSEPHEGYRILKKWADSKEQPSFVFTSNIDGHFERAGFEGQVNECHGTIKYLQCLGERKGNNCPKKNDMWLPDSEFIKNMQIDQDTDEVIGDLPTCPGCGGVARPTVMMFGDWVQSSSFLSFTIREFCLPE